MNRRLCPLDRERFRMPSPDPVPTPFWVKALFWAALALAYAIAGMGT